MKDRNAIEIQRIYLLQNQIGQGQGRRLIEYCLDWTRNKGYTSVWLGVGSIMSGPSPFMKKWVSSDLAFIISNSEPNASGTFGSKNN
ncbi:GNAT family N-acetyltransferase [Spirosoma telluris]|uniref:GNAT family N-acetyltransferase n=1 Tax=Spirosoma telluris TaxID=2183553 RepID=UPI002FC34E7F